MIALYTIIRIPAHDVAKVNIHVKYGHGIGRLADLVNIHVKYGRGIGKVGGFTHDRQLTYLQA